MKVLESKEEILRKINQMMDEKVGWAKFKNHTVTKESIQRFGKAIDPANPLWYDEEYAASTRWNGIIAFPTFEITLFSGVLGDLPVPREWGFQTMVWIGEDWKMWRPVKPGDRIKVWQRRPQIIEFEPEEGENFVFGLVDCDCDYINEHDELVSSVKVYVERVYHKLPVYPPPIKEYGYTRDELLYLAKLMREEKVRGDKILYWEDVKVGDRLPPVVLGPTTMVDNAIAFLFSHNVDAILSTRSFFLNSIKEEDFGEEILQDPLTGLYYIRGGPAGRHWSNRSAQLEGEPMAFLFGVLSKFTLLRTITNWMGDDGFIKEFKWRHMVRSYVGDALISSGIVIDKWIENEEYLVKIKLWLENLRGYITEAAIAIVSLFSKNKGLKKKIGE